MWAVEPTHAVHRRLQTSQMLESTASDSWDLVAYNISLTCALLLRWRYDRPQNAAHQWCRLRECASLCNSSILLRASFC